MRQRALIFSFVLMTAVFASSLEAQDRKDIEAAKAAFLKEHPVSGETARLHYVHELLKMNDKLMLLAKSPKWTASVDACFLAINGEMKKHPAPTNSDSKALSKMKVGKWQSPRHDYIFKSNGAWRMAPESGTSHGRWRIEGNKYWEEDCAYTIILLDQDDFVFTDGDVVFYENRI